METSLRWITLISGALALVLALLPSFANLRAQTDDGRVRFTNAGRAVLALAGVAFVFTTLADAFRERKEAGEKAAEQRAFQTRTAEITDRQQTVLQQLLELRDQTTRLRDQQHLALLRADSARQDARSTAEQLRLSTEETQRIVQRARNPVASLEARFTIAFTTEDSTSGEVLNQLYQRSSMGRRAVRTEYMFDDALLIRGERRPMRFPDQLTLYFTRPVNGCNAETSGETILSAERKLEFDSAAVLFHGAPGRRTLYLSWRKAPFQLWTHGPVSVDDLSGACVRMSLRSNLSTLGAVASPPAEGIQFEDGLLLPMGRVLSLDHPIERTSSGWITRVR